MDQIKQTKIPGVLIIKRPTFSDERGFFHEVFRKNEIEEAAGQKFEIVQQNHSHSVRGTLRGIHAAPWSKLVYCPNGLIQEVVVDLRPDSKTYKQWVSIKLGDESHLAVFIPPFCGNAFLVLSDEADYCYLVSDYWAAGQEYGLIWNDPELNIKWEIEVPVLSEKDAQNPTLSDLKK